MILTSKEQEVGMSWKDWLGKKVNAANLLLTSIAKVLMIFETLFVELYINSPIFFYMMW